MTSLLGIDLGTSSVRAMLMQADGQRLGLAARSYDVDIPAPGRAEQDPDMWVARAEEAIREVLAAPGVRANDIAALSFSGQMHGLVCVDKNGRPLRPAIIWQDQRSKKSIESIYERFGRERVGGWVQNSIAAGFLVASLVWLKDNEAELYSRIDKVMLPKDYLKFRLSGVIATDYSDAAGSAAFDNTSLSWSGELLSALDLDPDLFPPCLPATERMGTVTPEASARSGLSTSTIVVNGGADQCMQGVGNGIVRPGVFSSNIGTGGQVSAIADKPLYDQAFRTNTIAHVIPGRWTLMGATLSAGAAMKWLSQRILAMDGFGDVDRMAGAVPAGSGSLVFLPYLVGERTPHLDPDARGMFCGLTLGHGRANMLRAVMEGVAFALRDSLEIILQMGIPCTRMIASGGGANSPLWLQIQANIFNREVVRSLNDEQACLGAAITAGVGAAVYTGFPEACDALVQFDPRTYVPSTTNARVYDDLFAVFHDCYRDNKKTFARLAALESAE
ncbi:MAG: xylulokinase [Planctomycetaceae bacterium]|nr:xylulokinase [Planctomycetaceae bacterium]